MVIVCGAIAFCISHFMFGFLFPFVPLYFCSLWILCVDTRIRFAQPQNAECWDAEALLLHLDDVFWTFQFFFCFLLFLFLFLFSSFLYSSLSLCRRMVFFYSFLKWLVFIDYSHKIQSVSVCSQNRIIWKFRL